MEMMDTSLLKMSRARNPPVKASGMVNITMKGDLKLWNWATIMRYTRSTPRAIILARSAIASMIILFSPVNS